VANRRAVRERDQRKKCREEYEHGAGEE